MYSSQRGRGDKLSLGAQSYLRLLQRNIRTGTTGIPEENDMKSSLSRQFSDLLESSLSDSSAIDTPKARTSRSRTVSFNKQKQTEDDISEITSSTAENVLFSLSDAEDKPSPLHKRNSSLIDIDVSSIATSRRPSMSFKEIKKLQQSIDQSLYNLGSSEIKEHSDSEGDREKNADEKNGWKSQLGAALGTSKKKSLFKRASSTEEESSLEEVVSAIAESGSEEIPSKSTSKSVRSAMNSAARYAPSFESSQSDSESRSSSRANRSITQVTSTSRVGAAERSASQSTSRPKVSSRKSLPKFDGFVFKQDPKSEEPAPISAPKFERLGVKTASTQSESTTPEEPSPAFKKIASVDKSAQIEMSRRNSSAQTRQPQQVKRRSVETQTNSIVFGNVKQVIESEERLYVDTAYLEKMIQRSVAGVSHGTQPIHQLMCNVMRTHMELTRSYAEREFKTLVQWNKLLKEAGEAMDSATYDKLKKLIDNRTLGK